MSKCPVCNFETKTFGNDDSSNFIIDCYRCGKFILTDEALHDFSSFIRTEQQKSHLSSWLRENQRVHLFRKDLQRLSELITPKVEEKAEKLLNFLTRSYPNPGTVIPNIDIQLRLLFSNIDQSNLIESTKISADKIEFVLSAYAHSWCTNFREFSYVLLEYLWKHKKVFEGALPQKITPIGWEYIYSFRQRNIESQIAFIAMKFDDGLKIFSEKYVESAILDAGYKPIRIDKYEHNNLIDDEIISNIKKSKFIVADFTFNNYGVYYEAGYARGMNIPVISLCEEKQFHDKNNKVHFDTNHYSFILYEKEKGSELRKSLKLRIEATIGKGNYIQ